MVLSEVRQLSYKSICDDLIIEKKSPLKKFVKPILLLLLVGAVVVFFVVIKPRIPSLAGELPTGEDVSAEDTSDAGVDAIADNTVTASGLDYARSQMNASCQTLYDIVLESLRAGQTEIRSGLGSYSSDEIIEAVRGVYFDHPEFCWFTGTCQYTYDEYSGKVSSVTLAEGRGLCCSPSEIRTIQEEAENAAADIIQEAQKKTSDFEKVLYVHDALVNSIDYDQELAARRGDNESSRDSLKCSMYGALVDKGTVCQGYTLAFEYIVKQLGFECAYVSGSVASGSHAWNLIKLDGDYYYVDVTWDDPIFDGDQFAGRNTSHRYFCITTRELESDHTLDADLRLPECTATACDYYVRNGLYLETYSYDAVEKIIEDAVAKNRNPEIKFGSEKEYQTAKSRLVDNQELYDMFRDLNIENQRFSYIDRTPAIEFIIR